MSQLRRRQWGCLLAVAAVLVAVRPAGAAMAGSPRSRLGQPGPRTRVACARPAAGHAACHARIVTARADGAPPSGSSPQGYNPADLRDAYKLGAASGGSGQTVAVVAAFDDPSAESDLAAYRSQFGLPPCTASGGCFTKVNQTGGSTPPAPDAGWAAEISLDLDMVSAICPNCRILLVEASSTSFADLGVAVDTAVVLGAGAISNSYGGSESAATFLLFGAHYHHPGNAITVSSGDLGFAVEFPASSPFVTAVGGTSLTRAANSRGWTETAWSGAGSGCSALAPKPPWQRDPACSRRTVADVAAVADPATGVSVYDSFGQPGGPWLVAGGTSASAPIIAGVYALAGNATTVLYGRFPYAHPGGLFDVTAGSNGACGGSYLCTAVPGYDGPTGLGTPNGTSSF
jgi:subtilase family serine protease